MTELPKGWVDVTVGDAAIDVSSGFASGRHNADSVGIPHLRPMNVSRNGEIDLGEVKYVAPEAGDRRLAFGDVLFNNTNSPVLVGKTAAYLSHEEVAFSNHMTRVRLHQGVNPSFVARQLHHTWASGGFSRLISNHVNQASIASSRLASEVRLRVAPVAEQERIVAAIEEAFSKLDAGEAGLRTVRQLLKRMRDAVLTAAVTGRLVPQDPTDTPATKLLADLGVEPLDSPPLGVLDSWETVRLWQVAEVRLGRQRSPQRATGPRMRPYLRAANVGWDGLRLDDVKEMSFTQAESETFELMHGDLLLSEASGSPGEVGKPAQYRDEVPGGCCFQNTLIRVRLEVGLDSDYYEHFFRHEARTGRFASGSRGVGIHHLGQKALREWLVPVPPPEEQARIVSEVERQLSFIDACERAVDVGLARSAALRRSVLKAAFEGKLVPQDPSDEPASVLLERIRAERSAQPVPKRRTRQTA